MSYHCAGNSGTRRRGRATAEDVRSPHRHAEPEFVIRSGRVRDRTLRCCRHAGTSPCAAGRCSHREPEPRGIRHDARRHAATRTRGPRGRVASVRTDRTLRAHPRVRRGGQRAADARADDPRACAHARPRQRTQHRGCNAGRARIHCTPLDDAGHAGGSARRRRATSPSPRTTKAPSSTGRRRRAPTSRNACSRTRSSTAR